MRLNLVILLLVALAPLAAGCSAFQVEAGFVQPAGLTATAEAGTTRPTVAPTPNAETTKTPLPATPQPAVSPSATATRTQPTSEESDADAAVQIVLDYFDAVNEGDYARAYRYWRGGGAANYQSYDEFARGYANTVHASVQLGTVVEQRAGAGRSVTVPVRLTSVVNETGGNQRVQRYEGTYTLGPGTPALSSAASWQIARASVAEVPGSPPMPVDVADPVALLRSYFEAIDRREYARAYTYWNYLGRASQQTFAQFHSEFAAIEHVIVDVGEPAAGGAAGSVYAEVPAVIVMTQSDQTTRTFCGTYTLRRANVPPFDQLGWRIERAEVAPTTTVQSGSAEAKSLLSGGCTPASR